jgi:hypothetical protein
MKRHLTLLLLLGSAAFGQDHRNHHAGVDARGDKVMGFSHEKTAHHFRLFEDGGSIEVEAKSADDTGSRDQIRRHLGHIATMFAEGNFTAPMLIHAKTPPGVPTMQKLKADVTYRFRETPRGGAVEIRTTNREAIAAVHEFLRFQIADHRTGDTGTVERRPK